MTNNGSIKRKTLDFLPKSRVQNLISDGLIYVPQNKNLQMLRGIVYV